jgi:hypothetical protein
MILPVAKVKAHPTITQAVADGYQNALDVSDAT